MYIYEGPLPCICVSMYFEICFCMDFLKVLPDCAQKGSQVDGTTLENPSKRRKHMKTLVATRTLAQTHAAHMPCVLQTTSRHQ